MSQNNTIRSAYTSVVISVTLVLVILGILGTLMVTSKFLSNHVKENLKISIFLNDNVKDIELKKLKKLIVNKPYVKQITYVTKQEAAKELQEQLSEDFLNFLGYNPLKNSIDVSLKANYVSTKYIHKIEGEFIKWKGVDDVVYNKSLIKKVTDNIKKISFWLLGICAIFLFVSIMLINNSIRLAIYSKRFLVKTMQLVGASKPFIIRPFIFKGLQLSCVSGVFAIVLLSVGFYYLEQRFPTIVMQNIIPLSMMAVSIILTSMLISLISVFFSMRRYLNTRLEQLYY